jgi:hypothetical protein
MGNSLCRYKFTSSIGLLNCLKTNSRKVVQVNLLRNGIDDLLTMYVLEVGGNIVG